MNDYATRFLGHVVHITVDRKMGSSHPEHGFVYPVNYGYVENVFAPDNEELDAYILEIDTPINEFTGRCIAVLHRLDDNDDKLIIVPDGISLTDDQIMNQVNFQEQYFKTAILRRKVK